MTRNEFDTALTRRHFMVTAVAAAALGLAGCASTGKKAKKPKTPGQVLADGIGKLKRRIKKHVEDKSRQEPALQLVEQAQDHIKRFVELLDESRNARTRLPVDQQTQPKLLEIIEEYDGKIHEKLLSACDLGVQMRQHVTKAEWPLVFPQPNAKGKEAAA